MITSHVSVQLCDGTLLFQSVKNIYTLDVSFEEVPCLHEFSILITLLLSESGLHFPSVILESSWFAIP
jgi:hypothetical protein